MGLVNVLQDLDLNLYACGRTTCGREWDFPAVTSPFARFFHVYSGAAEVRFQGRRLALRPGQVVLTPPFVPVDYRCSGRFDHLYVVFTCRTRTGLDFFSFAAMRFTVEADALTAALFQRLHAFNPDRELDLIDPRRPDYDRSLWRSVPGLALPPEHLLATDGILRLILARFLTDPPAPSGDLDGGRFLPVVAHIQANLHADLTLPRLAALARMRPSHFSDHFLAEIGSRPIAYLTRKRMEHAQFLLLSTRSPLKEIAAACGYRDANYFLRVFRRQVGLTPSEYRRQGL